MELKILIRNIEKRLYSEMIRILSDEYKNLDHRSPEFFIILP